MKTFFAAMTFRPALTLGALINRHSLAPLAFAISLVLGLVLAPARSTSAQDTPDIKWLGGGQGGQTGVAVSPDGQFVATSSAFQDNTIKLWRRSDGQLVRTFAEDFGGIEAVAFSPNGQLLASAAGPVDGLGDSTVRVWNVATGTVVANFSTGNGRSFSVAISADGQYLAAGVNTVVMLWRLSDGVRLNTFTGHSFYVFGVAFSPDGTTLASASGDNTIKLWQVPTGTLLRTLTGHTDSVDSVAFSPDGQTLASGSWDLTVKLWRVSDGTPLQTLTGHSKLVRSVAFSAGGGLLASAAWDSTIKLWQTTDWSLVRTITDPEAGSLQGAVFTPDGRALATATIGGHARLFRVTDGTVLQTFGHHTASIQGIAFSHDGKLFASGAIDLSVKLWDATEGKELRTLIGHNDGIRAISFSPDGQIVATSSGEPPPDTRDTSIRLWRISDGIQLRLFPGHGGGTYSIDYSPDGQNLVSGGGDRLVKIWRTSDGALLRTLSGHTQSVYSVAYSPDGTMIASGGGEIRLWRVLDGSLIRTFASGNTESLAFSPDGQTLATGKDADGNNLLLWRVSDGALLRTINADPNAFVQSVAFSPDGNTVLSASGYTFLIRQWRVSDGVRLASYTRETGWGQFPSLPVAFSPDGTLFGYGRGDSTLVVAHNSFGPGPTPTPTPTPPPSPHRVLIPYADFAPPADLQTALLAEGVAAADVIDVANSTPTVAQLRQYDIVVPFSNIPFADSIALGNNLADYVDGGGIVVQFGFSFQGPGDTHGIDGRWLSGGYSPYAYSPNFALLLNTLGTFAAGHPLMQGVTALQSNAHNVVTPAAGATQVGAWDNGDSLVAYKTVGGRTTVGVTAYIGDVATWTGDFARVIANAGRWLKPPLALTTVVSRKTHGAAGDFDIPLPLTGEPGVECRSSGATDRVVFTFTSTVVSGTAAVTAGAGSAGAPSFSGTTMIIPLSSVADIQKITVTLSNVTSSTGQVLPNTAVSMNVLLGDTNGNKSVNASDIAQTKAQAGASATAANFRTDVNANGTVNSSDVSQVKANSGHSVP